MLSLRSPAGKRGAPSELEKAKAEAERAKADSVAAQARADQARVKLEKSTRDAKVRLRATAVIMMTAALVRLGWEAANAPPPVVKPSLVQPMTASKDAMSLSSSNAAVPEAEIALDRLRNAFHTFPEKDQPIVVREVNERYAGTEFTCPLAWAEGIPALSVKDQGNSQPMVAAALNRCAAGVERLRREIDAAAEHLSK